MKEYLVCQDAIDDCLAQKRFTVASLYTEQRTLDMHMHDCYEIYYALSGGNQFFIDDKWYEIQKGDLFAINNYETHHVFEKSGAPHERYVISIHPEFLSSLSTSQTDLTQCFQRKEGFSHKVSLDKENRQRLAYLLHKISSAEGYGADLIENNAFSELMLLVNQMFLGRTESEQPNRKNPYNELVASMIDYISQNVTGDLSLDAIADHFFMSKSYLCRLFKSETGTTISKYITARRLSLAKSLLASGCSVSEACDQCGFGNYANFIKAFTKAVGISPKRYGRYSSM